MGSRRPITDPSSPAGQEACDGGQDALSAWLLLQRETALLPWGAVRSVGAVALPWAQLRAEDLVPYVGNLPEVT